MNELVAIIVENRLIPGLNDIIAQHEKFLPKGTDIWLIKNEPINSIADYNKLMTSRRLWRNLNFDRVLIFQSDSLLVNYGIENFLKWEMIGAPIAWFQNPLLMNGGLSIRCPKAMLKVLNKIPYDGNAEDLFFCKALISLGHEMPTVDEAMKFSVETMYYPTPIGLHAPEKYLTKEQCYNLRNQTS